MTERLHRPTEAASFVQRLFKRPFSVAYQAKLRSVGGGPRFVRTGRFIAYAESELIAHFARQVSKPLDSTSSAVQPAAPDTIFDIDDRDLEDEGPYSHLFTGDRTFDQITKEEYPEFDIDLEIERTKKKTAKMATCFCPQRLAAVHWSAAVRFVAHERTGLREPSSTLPQGPVCTPPHPCLNSVAFWGPK